MDKLEAAIAKLEATAARLVESGDPGKSAKGRATRGILIPITRWLENERAAGGDPGPSIEAFTQSVAQGLVMVSDQAAPEGQSAMPGVESMLQRIFAIAHNFSQDTDVAKGLEE